jgi:hypothetical protein
LREIVLRQAQIEVSDIEQVELRVVLDDSLKVGLSFVVALELQLADAGVMASLCGQRIVWKFFQKLVPLIGSQIVNAAILEGDGVAILANRSRRRFRGLLRKGGHACRAGSENYDQRKERSAPAGVSDHVHVRDLFRAQSAPTVLAAYQHS